MVHASSLTTDSPQLPIALFDSGVGGLTVLSALHNLLPHENLLYLGDTARLPYGTKSIETITRYALQCTAKLIERQCKLLVIACNTATAAALENIQQAYPTVPVVGVIAPGAQAACQASKNQHICVLGTESTIQGGAYTKAIKAIKPKAQVTGVACPLFVPLAEENWINGELVEGIIARYLLPTLTEKPDIDCIVLGCTHFPLLAEAITNVMQNFYKGKTPPVLVNSAATTANAIATILTHNKQLTTASTQGSLHFLTTDDKPRFIRTGSQFLGFPIPPSSLELIDL